jgi:hypothetical protein
MEIINDMKAGRISLLDSLHPCCPLVLKKTGRSECNLPAVICVKPRAQRRSMSLRVRYFRRRKMFREKTIGSTLLPSPPARSITQPSRMTTSS